MNISTAIERTVASMADTFVWNLGCTVAYLAQENGFINSTILSVEIHVNYLCVVLMDLDEGHLHVETISLPDLYQQVLENYLQDEARLLASIRQCSIDDIEVVEVDVDEKLSQLNYVVRWFITEGRPGRDVSFLETGSLTL